MAGTHYETLGISRDAKEADIKAAYRRLALRHHPDRSKDPNASAIFQRITLAYETLSDAMERGRYDLSLQDEKRRSQLKAEDDRRKKEEDRQKKEREKVAAGMTTSVKTRTATADVSLPSMLTKLSVMFSRQQFSEAERLAREILRRDAHQALPYAVLGDICRARGNLEDAARMYSYALQMQPTNELYLKRYEEILDRAQLAGGAGRRVRLEPEERRTFAILSIVAIALMACIYIVVSPEKPALGVVGPISTWTLGLVVMLFVCGAAAGAALTIGNLIDRLDAFSNGKIAPAVLLGLIAIVSFPAACVLYFAVGFSQRAFNITTTRLVTAVAALTASLAMASLTTQTISFAQVMVWGGNLVYLGALCGWTVSDGLRKP